MSDKEDFDHENRIYTLEGKFKVYEEESFKWKDDMEFKYNNLSGKLIKLSHRKPVVLQQWDGLKMTPKYPERGDNPIILEREFAKKLLHAMNNECTKQINEFVNKLEELLK